MAAVKKRRAPPAIDQTRHADTMHIVADVADTVADIDLLAIPGKPKHPPQLTVFYNRSVDTDATIVITPEKGVNLTLVVPFGRQLEVYHPIRTVLESGSSGGLCDAYFYWWDASSLDWNNEA